MKKFIYIIFFIYSLFSISYGIDRFPIITLENCTEHNRSPNEIYLCEKNNFAKAQETLAIFYMNILLFLSEEHRPLLQKSQNNWEKFSLSECKINAYQFKDHLETNKISEVRCLNYRIKARIQHLIYIVMIWEKNLGSFQIIFENPDHSYFPFILEENKL